MASAVVVGVGSFEIAIHPVFALCLSGDRAAAAGAPKNASERELLWRELSGAAGFCTEPLLRKGKLLFGDHRRVCAASKLVLVAKLACVEWVRKDLIHVSLS